MSRLVAAALLLQPSHASAQITLFLDGVAQLVAAVAASDADHARAKETALETMAAGLAGWDRSIRSQEARVESEVASGSPSAFALRLALGTTYLERGRLGDALREFDAAIAIESTHADPHALRGVVLEALGQPEAAAQAFLAAWMNAPDDPARAYDLLRLRAQLDAAHGALLEASRRLTREGRPPTTPFITPGILRDNLSREPVLSDSATKEGYALLARQEYDDALASLRMAPARVPDGDSPIARFTRAMSHEARNEISAARREYEGVVGGTLAGRYILYRGIGLLARAEGDFAGVLSAFERAVRLNPNDADGHLGLAQAYMEQERLDDAFREAVAALLIDSRNARAHALAGQIHLEQGRAEDAVVALRRALELLPADHEPRYALATALTRLGRDEEAAREREAFERASRAAVDRRRREMGGAVEREEALHERLSKPGTGR